MVNYPCTTFVVVADIFPDAVAAAVLHPLEPNLVSVSGSRHFDGVAFEHQSASESSSDESAPRTRAGPQRPFSKDTSIKLWTFRTREALGFEVEAVQPI